MSDLGGNPRVPSEALLTIVKIDDLKKNKQNKQNKQQRIDVTCPIPTRSWARSGPVRISVAYGNIPAPGRRKIVCARLGDPCGMSAIVSQIQKRMQKIKIK